MVAGGLSYFLERVQVIRLDASVEEFPVDLSTASLPETEAFRSMDLQQVSR